MTAWSRPITGGSIGTQAGSEARRHLYLRSQGAEFQHVISRLQPWLQQRRRLPEIALRATATRQWAVEAAARPGGSNGKLGEGRTRQRRCSCAVGDLQGVEDSVESCGKSGGNRRAEVLVAATATVVLGVGNRVLYKLALVPLKQYPFFLAQLATFGYGQADPSYVA